MPRKLTSNVQLKRKSFKDVFRKTLFALTAGMLNKIKEIRTIRYTLKTPK